MMAIFLLQFRSQVMAAFVSQYITIEKPSACRQLRGNLRAMFSHSVYTQLHSMHIPLSIHLNLALLLALCMCVSYVLP